MKKVLSIVLSIAMVVCLAPTMAFAGTTTAAQANAAYSDIEGTACEGAVNVLSALGVVDGFTDGTYKPEQTVTRAQMAKLIVTALGVADYATATTSKFVDMGTATWAIPYVEYASNLNIVNGVGNGKFNPNGLVTYEQAATMIVRALGYTNECKEMNGTWPAIYVQKAIALGIFEGVTNGGANGATRGDIAIMLYNALELAQVYADADGATHYKTGNNSAKYNGEIVSGVTMMGTLNKNGSAGYGIVTDTDVDGAAKDVRAYLGAAAKITKDKNGDVIAIGDVKTQFLTGNFDGDDTFTVGDTEYICYPKYKTINKDGISSTTKDGVIKFVNGKVVTEEISVTDKDGKTTKETRNVLGKLPDKYDKVDYTIAVTIEGKTITGIYSIATWTANNAAKISDSQINQIVKNKKLLGLNFEKNNDGEINTDSFTLAGVDSLSDIKKDNIVAVYNDGKDGAITKVEVGTEVVKGEITRVYNDKITIDGKNYKFSTLKNAAAKINDEIFKAGNEVELRLDYNGKIYFAELVNGMAGNYAVVIDKTSDYDKDEDGKIDTGMSASTLKVKMIFADGTVKTVEADASKLNDNIPVAATKEDLAKSAAAVMDEIVSKTLVTYQLNSDGQLVDIEKVKYSNEDTVEAKVSASGVYDTYTISDAVAIFKLPEGSDDETKASNYSVIQKSAIVGTKVIADYKLNKAGTQIAAMTITKSLDETDVYGILNGKYTNADDETVVNGFIGKDALTDVVLENPDEYAENTLFKITKSSDKYNIAIFNKGEGKTGTILNTDKASAYVKDNALYDTKDERVKAFGSAPVVYVWNDKTEEYEVGDLSDIDVAGKNVEITWYVTEEDADKDDYGLITYVTIKNVESSES